MSPVHPSVLVSVIGTTRYESEPVDVLVGGTVTVKVGIASVDVGGTVGDMDACLGEPHPTINARDASANALFMVSPFGCNSRVSVE